MVWVLHWRTRRAGSARRAVAALEFGLIAPLMVALLCGIVDTAEGILTLRRVATVSQETGEIASQLAIQSDQTTALTVNQLYQAETAIYAILPAARYASASSYAVTATEINYSAPTSACYQVIYCTSYTANVAWSVPLSKGLAWQRPCGVVTQTNPGAPQTVANGSGVVSTMPTLGMTEASSVLVIDVAYNYTPFFTRFLTGTITMRSTSYFVQRSLVSPYITYDAANATADISAGIVCTGYT